MIKKEEFINLFRAKGYTKTASEKIYDDFIETLTEALVNGDNVMFHGFGTFSVGERKETLRYDVNAGKTNIVPSHKCVKFTVGNRLRNAIKEGVLRK